MPYYEEFYSMNATNPDGTSAVFIAETQQFARHLLGEIPILVFYDRFNNRSCNENWYQK